MQRPTLNPSMFEDADCNGAIVSSRSELEWALGRAGRRAVQGACHLVIQGVRGLVRLLLMPVHPVRPMQMSAAIDNSRGMHGWIGPVLFRVIFLVILMLGTVGVLVHGLAYPPGVGDAGMLARTVSGAGGPICAGLFAEPVQLSAADGVTSSAWRIHAIDADTVLRRPGIAVRAKWPAVVLVPGLPGDGHALDALIEPLHQRGYVVMVLRTRGPLAGEAQPHTFGLNERYDVTAAVAHVRSLSYVDASRVTVIGVGTGGTAALLSHEETPVSQRPMQTLVYDVPNGFEDILTSHRIPGWLGPVCRWGFEMSQRVDVSELNTPNLLRQPGVTLLTTSPTRASAWRRMIALLEPALPATAPAVGRASAAISITR
jgi:hypothetical protein